MLLLSSLDEQSSGLFYFYRTFQANARLSLKTKKAPG